MHNRGKGSWGVDESFGPGCLRLRAYRDLLREILAWERRGRSVLALDLAREMERPRQTVHQQIARLAEDGWVELGGDAHAVRSVWSTGAARALGARLGAPILGYVPAGLKRAATDGAGRGYQGERIYLQSWDEALPPNEDYNIFFVRGDSMTGDGILPGDRVQIETGVQLADLEAGEIAVVTIGDFLQATLKHVFYDKPNNEVTLRVSNALYQDVLVSAGDIHIVGAFFGLVRVSDRGARPARK